VVDMEAMVDTAEAMEAMAVMVDTVVRGKLRLMLLLPLRLMLLLLPHLRLMLKLTGMEDMEAMEAMVDTAEAMEAMAVMVDTVVREKLKLRLTVAAMAVMEDMEDMEDMEVDTEAMVDTVERGKLMLRLTVMVDMEDMVVDMAVTDMEADTTFKQIFHQHNYVRVLDPIRFIIFN